jgi:DNA invertase Pin-like site-specific DNA recombinase
LRARLLGFFAISQELGVAVSLTEKIETASPVGNLVFHVFAALAKFERNLIRERTLAGLRAARTAAEMEIGLGSSEPKISRRSIH